MIPCKPEEMTPPCTRRREPPSLSWKASGRSSTPTRWRPTRSQTCISRSAAASTSSIAGPSGCGKTTLLSLLGLLDTPSEGKYFLDRQRRVEPHRRRTRAAIRNRQIGFIFQAFNLIGDLTVFENVELPLTYRGMSSGERKQRVQEALERVGMSHRMKHYPSQLSGGQQQRVAVARAIAGDPLILLADEPTGNLDSENGEAVMELLESCTASGATICMVTHDPRYAAYADRDDPPLRRPGRRGAARC